MQTVLSFLALARTDSVRQSLTAHERLARHVDGLKRLAPGQQLHAPKVFEDKMLPMRDGVRLSTIAISPPGSNASKFPAVIDRSPYGHEGTEL